ncbi:hypothetical protein GN244_ATG09225 [Phytophthora infestans]|uniref:Uncharacterized protein n=1 Tax=Phytophthora infestans TaxID=4787 RepID=A0A833TCI5_PHYIN|nr:hypothetical protein GN244_ATG09225 [Phytophthora infestans]
MGTQLLDLYCPKRSPPFSKAEGAAAKAATSRAWPGLPRESSDAAEEKAAPMEAANAREEEHLDAGSAAEQTEPTIMNNDTADSDHSASEVIWIPPPRVAEAKLTLREALGDGDSSTSLTPTSGMDGACMWEAPEEPADKLPPGMVAAFNRRRRAQVRQVFIEDEAGHTRDRRRPSVEAPSSRVGRFAVSAAHKITGRIQILLVNTVTPKRTAPSYLIRFFSDVVLCRIPTVCRCCYRIAARGKGLRPPPRLRTPQARARCSCALFSLFCCADLRSKAFLCHGFSVFFLQLNTS